MSEFKVNQAELSAIAKKYDSVIMRAGMLRTIPKRVNDGLQITKQSSKDITIIQKNINTCSRELDQLCKDLVILRSGIQAVKTGAAEADRNVKNIFKTFTFSSFIKRYLEKAKSVLHEDDVINTFTEHILSQLQVWFAEKQPAPIMIDPSEEPVIIILNPSSKPDTIEKVYTEQVEIEQVTTEDFVPSSAVHDNAGTVYTDENGITHLVIGGMDTALTEYPVGSVYPNLYKIKINGEYVDLGGAQCLGFARYVHTKMYGSYHNPWGNDDAGAIKRKTHAIPSGEMTAELAKQLITEGGVGAHIRTYNKNGLDANGSYGHSQIVTDITENGFSVIDANGSGNGMVCVHTYTWDQYMKNFGKNGIHYIENYAG